MPRSFTRPSLRIAASVHLALLLAVAHAGPARAAGDDYDAHAVQRTEMLRQIEISTMKTAALTGTEFMDGKVLRAIRLTPRHLFLPRNMQDDAYENERLDIAERLRLESPFIVALMNQVAEIQPEDRVLVAATGTGYHAAVLSQMAQSVYSVDGNDAHTRRANERLAAMEIANVATRTADSYLGWPEEGPFDVIIIRESVDHVPRELTDQLKPGGRMVMPIGPEGEVQRMTLIRKDEKGELSGRHVLEAFFPAMKPGNRT